MSSTSAPASQSRNTTAWLVGFGVLQGLMGLAMLAFAGLALLTLAMPAPPSAPKVPVASVVSAAAIYVVLGLLAGTLGIGSIWCRRWARNITLVLAWMALACGAVALPGTVIVLPAMAEATPGMKDMLPVMVVGSAAVIALVLIAIPVAFILVYGSRHARATCEWKDPEPSWTERVPLRVLALVLVCAYTAVGYPVMGFAYPVPLFGTVLTGAAKVVVTFALGTVFGVAAWGLYRLRPWAWWLSMALLILLLVSYATTSRRPEVWEAMTAGMPPEQAPAVAAIAQSTGVLVLSGVAWLCALAYMLHVRKLMAAPPSAES